MNILLNSQFMRKIKLCYKLIMDKWEATNVLMQSAYFPNNTWISLEQLHTIHDSWQHSLRSTIIILFKDLWIIVNMLTKWENVIHVPCIHVYSNDMVVLFPMQVNLAITFSFTSLMETCNTYMCKQVYWSVATSKCFGKFTIYFNSLHTTCLVYRSCIVPCVISQECIVYVGLVSWSLKFWTLP